MGWAWVVLWGGALAVPMTLLAAGHLVALPIAAAEPVEAQTPAADLAVTHVLAGDCGCSIQVARWLADRDAVGADRVLWVGDDDPLVQQLTEAGYDVALTSGDDVFAEHGVVGTPCILVHDGDGQLRYRGGYAPRRPVSAGDLQDCDVVRRLAAGQATDAMPAFGCASYGPTRDRLDPLGLKAR